MNDYLNFAEVAGELGCTLNKVRTLVVENKTLRATRIAKNGLVLDSCGPEGHFPYDLDFCCHLDDNGEITSDIYGSDSTGRTVLLKTLDVGALRVERADLENFRMEHPARPALGCALEVPESKEQRQDRRLNACEDAGLVMPKSSAGRLPDGVAHIAKSEGIERQSFSTDVKAALKRRESDKREGVTVHRA